MLRPLLSILPLLIDLPIVPRAQSVQMRDRSRDNEVRWRTSQQEQRRKRASRGMRDVDLQRQRPSKGDTAKLELGQKRKLAGRAASGGRKQRARQRLASPPGFRDAAASGYRRDDGGTMPINTALVEAVLLQRDQARRKGDFASADRLRETLHAMGVEVSDSERVWRRIKTGGRRARQWRSTSERDAFYLELFFRGLALLSRR